MASAAAAPRCTQAQQHCATAFHTMCASPTVPLPAGKPASTAVSTPPPPQRPNVHDTQGSAAPSPPAPEADLKPLPSQQDGESSACTPLLQPRKPGVAFVVGAGALRTPLGEVATNTRYIVDGEKVRSEGGTGRNWPHRSCFEGVVGRERHMQEDLMPLAHHAWPHKERAPRPRRAALQCQNALDYGLHGPAGMRLAACTGCGDGKHGAQVRAPPGGGAAHDALQRARGARGHAPAARRGVVGGGRVGGLQPSPAQPCWGHGTRRGVHPAMVHPIAARASLAQSPSPPPRSNEQQLLPWPTRLWGEVPLHVSVMPCSPPPPRPRAIWSSRQLGSSLMHDSTLICIHAHALRNAPGPLGMSACLLLYHCNLSLQHPPSLSPSWHGPFANRDMCPVHPVPSPRLCRPHVGSCAAAKPSQHRDWPCGARCMPCAPCDECMPAWPSHQQQRPRHLLTSACMYLCMQPGRCNCACKLCVVKEPLCGQRQRSAW